MQALFFWFLLLSAAPTEGGRALAYSAAGFIVAPTANPPSARIRVDESALTGGMDARDDDLLLCRQARRNQRRRGSSVDGRGLALHSQRQQLELRVVGLNNSAVEGIVVLGPESVPAGK